MLTEFQTSPVRIGDIVKISGKKGRCVDGTLCRVLFVDNLTCTGRVAVLRKNGSQTFGEHTVSLKKMEIHDRPTAQSELF